MGAMMSRRPPSDGDSSRIVAIPSVCRAIGESVPTVTAAFVIYDYECISSMVLFKITFVAEVRGRFVSADGQQFELRQSGEHATYSAFSPSGCQAATLNVLDRLTPKLTSIIQQLPPPRSAARPA